ncbi:hypothetical protein BJV82DRAFT_196918 [Fennellomyces sp. T-0311]|nr:hypothetical protein BJV82DRAFT_196918 [Fennellomyces sp. T-0311]
MHDFTITLPFETIRLILSYLDHSDHVECMLVCHRWHDLIPIFASELWDHLLVTSDSWPKTNERLLLCLGPHIQYLFIQEAPPCQVLNTLKDKECKLTLLELACYRNFCISLHQIYPSIHY